MLVAQITDLHLGFDPDNPDEFNRQRLDRTLATLKAMTPRPDLLLVTGDIADNGDDKVSYGRFRDAIAGLPFPVCPAMGNHDSRDAFLEVFPETPVADGYIQYAIEDFPVRILVLDTLEIGRHGGGFDAVRAAWLEARLAEAPGRPTLLVLHHPPIETGLSLDDRESRGATGCCGCAPIVEAQSQYRRHDHRPSPPPDRDRAGPAPCSPSARRPRRRSRSTWRRWIRTSPTTGR